MTLNFSLGFIAFDTSKIIVYFVFTKYLLFIFKLFYFSLIIRHIRSYNTLSFHIANVKSPPCTIFRTFVWLWGGLFVLFRLWFNNKARRLCHFPANRIFNFFAYFGFPLQIGLCLFYRFHAFSPLLFASFTVYTCVFSVLLTVPSFAHSCKSSPLLSSR